MRRVRTKVCGIRALDEALAAMELGADALGFNFWPRSPRYVEPDVAGKIIERLPPFVSCIGVFVNEQPGAILEIASRARLDAIQLHGDEDDDYCEALGHLKIIKAFRVSGGFDRKVFERFRVSAYLLDAHIEGAYGGTGRRSDWAIAAEAARELPVILAGGLTPENVAEAITTVRPLGVDVCSGVEREPGVKDFEKMRMFMQEVSRVNA
ncbi:MAG TPA: phosphoribosylanthranilate isomerase [Blastocatellia bacterium]|nr:phosphoribosylanthranilate isomerase [Blastocatellia bacterium]